MPRRGYRFAGEVREVENGFLSRGSMWNMINVDPAFDSLRDEPRFQVLLQKLNLQ